MENILHAFSLDKTEPHIVRKTLCRSHRIVHTFGPVLFHHTHDHTFGLNKLHSSALPLQSSHRLILLPPTSSAVHHPFKSFTSSTVVLFNHHTVSFFSHHSRPLQSSLHLILLPPTSHLQSSHHIVFLPPTRHLLSSHRLILLSLTNHLQSSHHLILLPPTSHLQS